MTKEPVQAPRSFADQFALERFGDEGLLVNLDTGDYFRLNQTATQACLALQQSASIADARVLLATSLSMPADLAGTLLDGVRSELGRPSARAEIPGRFRYRRYGNEYELEDRGQPVLRMDDKGLRLRLCVPPSNLAFPLLDYVRAVTPKVLFLRGLTVLHASACELFGELVAFSGPSGAGKTTTAHAFAAAGATLIAEDLIILAPGDGPPRIVVGGEKQAHDWAATMASRLAQRPDVQVPCGDVLSGLAGVPSQALKGIWFLDKTRRMGTAVERRPVSGIAGLIALVDNTFLGAADAASWRHYIRESHRLAASLELSEVTLPEGLDELGAAARRYATNSAS